MKEYVMPVFESVEKLKEVFGENVKFVGVDYEDEHVKPKQVTSLWLMEMENGWWQRQPAGLGRHFVLDTSDASHLKYVESTTAELYAKGSPRKPREWWINESPDYHPFDCAYKNRNATVGCNIVRVREVIE